MTYKTFDEWLIEVGHVTAAELTSHEVATYAQILNERMQRELTTIQSQALELVELVKKADQMLDRSDAQFEAAMNEVGKRDSRISDLEAALAESHHMRVINLRRYEACCKTSQPVNDYLSAVHAPVKPHPLLATKP